MSLLGRMSLDQTVRRLRVLQSVLSPRRKPSLQLIRCVTSEGSGQVNIGDVGIKTQAPKSVELVPVKYLPENTPQSILRHLRWIMQKDVLGQDVFLIGHPGPLRRQVAMMYLELTNREAEYVSLSRDTTETDLKQRREIRSGTAYYLDQCAVRAAIEGRVLVLEGIEKAERNVLPILNNLLENREMQLDDGRFLVAADRYDKLLQDHTKEELDDLKLVRVSERFRVIALGLPVPRYQGNPLDPPLRSRFQARDIHPPPFKEQLESLQERTRKFPAEKLSQILSFATTMLTAESTALGLPDFPVANLEAAVAILDAMPGVAVHSLVTRLYPYEVMMGKEGRTAVTDTLKKFELLPRGEPACHVQAVKKGSDEQAEVTLTQESKSYTYQVPAGVLEAFPGGREQEFVATSYHDSLLADLLQSHMVKDFCIIGPRGCGKSAVVKQFADMLGYDIEPIMLYQDMTARDMLQQRTTLPSGDTTWRLSPLVTAALEGSLAILDGVHRINKGSFAVLHRLVHERELQLFDGSRLLRQDRFEEVMKKTGLSAEELGEKHIFRIHPSFRIVALAEPPVVGSSSQQWVSPEQLTMFLYHNMRSLSQNEEIEVIHTLVPDCPDLSKLLSFVHTLRDSHDSTVASVATSLSTRQLLRVARRLASYPSEDLYSVVQKACLARFLPRLAKSALEQSLEEAGIVRPHQSLRTEDGLERAVTCEVSNNVLRIGNTEHAVYNPDNKTKVPDVLFYENLQHLAVMEDMLKDFMLGEHLLLVGNQGVGKNKIVDRFLHLLNRPREYVQLHRDTTVQTLTLQPTVHEGIIVYEDSPLVRAVKQGHVLVVDEADKAPTHVTCILKTLVESGEMHLADGRRIVSAQSGVQPTDRVIVTHPDFHMIVLANRPGFPFLGNDFFGAMGDIFSCHAIDNPDMESEMSMLRQYGPDVPEATLEKLVLAFGELRDIADQGLIAYPYSTREVVNMVKHLQKFPDEGLASVVRNVFDFDSYNKELQETIVQTMQKHGVPLGANPADVNLAMELPLPSFEICGRWNIAQQGSRKSTSLLSLPVETRKLGIKGPVTMYLESQPLDRTDARSAQFTEQEAYWTIPMHETNVICDVGVVKAAERSAGLRNCDIIHVCTANPICVYTINPKNSIVNILDLYDVFPSATGSYRPRVRIAPLMAPLDDTVIIHEEVTNVVLSVNTENGEVTRLINSSMPETPPDKRIFPSSSNQKTSPFKLCSSTVRDPYGTVLFYKYKGDVLEFLNVLEGISHTVSLPVNVHSLHQVAAGSWLLNDADSNRKYILQRSEPSEFYLQPIEEADKSLNVQLMATSPLSDGILGQVLDQQISSPNRIAVTHDSYASVLVGFPELSSADVYVSQRTPLPSENPADRTDSLVSLVSKPPPSNAHCGLIYLPESGQVIRSLPYWKIPEEVYADGKKPKDVSGYLEVADTANHKLRYIPVPGTSRISPYASWLFSVSDTSIFMAGMSNDELVTVDVGGCVRLWETALVHLSRSLQEWRNMIGFEDSRPLQITTEKESSQVAGDPKHGKVDPLNTPHVGGNTWAGGTGGSNTAGLGGFGGPYRLDAGHDVTQVPQFQKDSVPEEVRQAAREMGQKAFKERLREIQMSQYDGDLYETYSKSVRRQVQSLRVILDSLQAKGKERQWLKHQTYGDLDDTKLIEGLTGEKSIYKRRGEKEPEMGSPQELPKRLRLLVDVSGSMYRFNGYDNRLEREMEAMLMVMEAFENYEDKFKFDIFGHSGEDYAAELAKFDKPPKNNKERLDVLKTMHAHSQFCISGDNTLPATRHAIKSLAEEEADERFVIILSDANFERYGISPRQFGELLRSNEDVNAYAIFIGSLGDQAIRLTKQLPMGHSYICMDTQKLPQILQQIFTSTMLSSR